MELVNLPLDGIRINGGTQPRVETNESAIADYAEFIRFGGELPPVVVFEDGAEIFLADGFHRYHAHVRAGAIEIACDVRQGTKRDAILFSVGANAAHGLRRTNDDKRKAVMTLLSDAEWAKWSNEAIARTCNVSPHTVAELKRSISANAEMPAVRTVERNGKTYEQNTANIGKAKDTPLSTTDSAPESGMVAAPLADTKPAVFTNSSAIDVDDLVERYEALCESFKETLANNEMMGRIFDADDRLATAISEIERYRAVAANAERSMAAKNGEYIERARAVTHWQNRALKAEKELAKLKAVA